MPGCSVKTALATTLALALLPVTSCPQSSLGQVSPSLPTPSTEPVVITNVAQLSQALDSEDRLYAGIHLEASVCAASSPAIGVVVARDTSGVEWLQLGGRVEKYFPGDRIRLDADRVMLRRRELGAQISPVPLVSNDGLHGYRAVDAEVVLQAGVVPLELDWFNGFRNFALEVFCHGPTGPFQRVSDSALWHANPQSAGDTNLLPGLQAECYEGYWDQVPDFDLLAPARTGRAQNFDLGFRTQDETVGLRFTGWFQAPSEGRYTFRVGSDDGSLLFVGRSEVPVRKIGRTHLPDPSAGLIGQAMDALQERRWLSLAGRVSFVSSCGRGLDLELRSGADTVSVKVADAAGVEAAHLLNTYVRGTGVGRAALSGSRRVVLDRLYVASGADLIAVDGDGQTPGATLPLIDIARVQAMQIADAKRELPVRIRGVVTAANRSDHWLALQDDTRGIFVDIHALSNSSPASAELWEVTGHTAAGNFAPVVMAEQLTRLGQSRMPEPTRPSWTELANGSMDVQRVEFEGLVSGVHSNTLDLLLPEGPLQVRMENHFERELNDYNGAVVRIRGTLFAIWNADTREVQFGSVLIRNGSINVITPPPADPFTALAKTARELLLFDAHATPFRPVKVTAQVLYSEPQRIFALNEGMGLRVLVADGSELQPGDWIEAVGYPEISGPSPLLRHAIVRKTGHAPLPKPVALSGADLERKGLDSTLVIIEGKLMAMHSEQNSTVMELQAKGHLFLARTKPHAANELSLRPGSKLLISGVFAETGPQQRTATQVESFELLLNSAADVQVLSQPSWWTLERLGAVVGFLVVVLVLAAAWITQLRHKVEQRTSQLQQQIRERERAEHHRALEAERSRIARDLHDDLGASLTEIGVLASTGQRANVGPGGTPDLFDAIAGKARGSIAALDVIVWAVDPEDNSLQSLADYLSGFAGEYLSHSNVACRFKIPVTFPPIMFEGRLRHDLFLTVKETLNNVVRHAQATEVEFGIAVTEGQLEIVISDNGHGFDLSRSAQGNGLKNLRGRLERLGGHFLVESTVGTGTTVRIRLPLPASESRREPAPNPVSSLQVTMDSGATRGI